MKFAYVSSAIKNEENENTWNRYILKPFLLGIAFGAGCYVAKIILTSPLMSNIVDKTVESAQKKINDLKL